MKNTLLFATMSLVTATGVADQTYRTEFVVSLNERIAPKCTVDIQGVSTTISLKDAIEAQHPRINALFGSEQKVNPASFEKQDSALDFGRGQAKRLDSFITKDGSKVVVLAAWDRVGNMKVELWESPDDSPARVYRAKESLPMEDYYLVNYNRIGLVEFPFGRDVSFQFSNEKEDKATINCKLVNL